LDLAILPSVQALVVNPSDTKSPIISEKLTRAKICSYNTGNILTMGSILTALRAAINLL
jgi:hypothetical protein